MTEGEFIARDFKQAYIKMKERALDAESKLRRAVDLMEDLLGLERGSGEKALAFINEFDRENS